MGQENVFSDILERIKAFLGYKKEVQKVEKFKYFQRGQPMVLVQKWPFFQLSFFRQKRRGKCVLRYSITQNSLFRLLKEEVQRVEKLTFFLKGLNHGFGPKMTIFPTCFF